MVSASSEATIKSTSPSPPSSSRSLASIVTMLLPESSATTCKDPLGMTLCTRPYRVPPTNPHEEVDSPPSTLVGGSAMEISGDIYFSISNNGPVLGEPDATSSRT